ncbi:glycoside hydrolase family 36 protein [Plantibacter sp. VKM Ac-2880]|uniref:glycoside hydrolase family 36 protein n=1 Tax=Plantibacter sp. VKM Ac-2880 TaxID=2783827 RepID=UPI00351C3646
MSEPGILVEGLDDGRLLRVASDAVELVFSIGADAPVSLVGMGASGSSSAPVPVLEPPLRQALVEVSAFGHGRFPGGFRHVDTVIGARLRYQGHAVDDGALRLRQLDPDTGLRVTSVFELRPGVSAFRTWTEVTAGAPLVLDFVSTFVTGAFLTAAPDVDGFVLASAANDWVAESRWTTRPLRELGLARIDRDLQHQPPRSRLQIANRGSWSSGEQAPTAALLAASGDFALAWQVEHNGPWSFELGETRHGAYLLLTGPTDQDNQWSLRLAAGETFASVPASVALAAGGVDEVLGALTRQRRAIRLVREIDRTLPIVFNDYMNTLMGDPTTDRLLPLIDAAADAGAELFCIDAGWYAEGHWWDTVGEWVPAASRFPGGLGEVVDHIRKRGMTAGLWLEPEVIGVRSPLAVASSGRALPDSAFFSRGGIRLVEHGRHLLDLRDPAARAHVTGVIDRLVRDHGIGFIKMDDNTMTGPGTDVGGSAPGAGLLEHARALLSLLDEVQTRHPRLLIESCASGAMRMDGAMLSRLHLQSTSDQQDPVKYATIAAAAPASMLPEQAGNWAYPVTGAGREAMVFALVNGMLGRLYLSGYLNRMEPAERALVREAVAAHRLLLDDIERSLPFWPLGLPAWEDGWVALGLRTERRSTLSLWRRPGAEASVVLDLPVLRGQDVEIEPFFPAAMDGWDWDWDRAAGTLTVSTSVEAPTARVLRLTTTPADTASTKDPVT